MIETMGNSIDEAVESSNDQGATTMQDESDTLLDVNEILDSTTSEMTEAEIVESGEQAIEDVANNVENKSAEAAANMMKSLVGGISAETIKNNAYASILAAILTLIGAIMMWKLRKIGFWIYVLGTVIGIVAPLIIYSGNLLGAISAIGIGFFGILFVVLYAINKKQLVY
jgi:predicted cobalt transporter CbtA